VFVCLCNAITDDTVKDAAKKSEDFEEMLKELDYHEDCGTCFCELKKIWDQKNKDV